MTWFGTPSVNLSTKFYVDINGIETNSVKINEVVRNGLKLKLSNIIVSFKALFPPTNSENKVKPAASLEISGPFDYMPITQQPLPPLPSSISTTELQVSTQKEDKAIGDCIRAEEDADDAGNTDPDYQTISRSGEIGKESEAVGKPKVLHRASAYGYASVVRKTSSYDEKSQTTNQDDALQNLKKDVEVIYAVVDKSKKTSKANETSAATPESVKARTPRSLRAKQALIKGDTVVRQSYGMSSKGDVEAAPKIRNRTVMGTAVLSRKADAAQKPPTALAVPREKNNIVMGQRALELAIRLSGYSPKTPVEAVRKQSFDPKLPALLIDDSPLKAAPRPSETADEAMEIFVPRRENGKADPHAPGFGLTVLPLPRQLVAAPRPSLRAKASPRKISAEEWDPIAAGKSATPVTLTKDPRALAMAARFANAVNGPNTRRPIPEGEKIEKGGVSSAIIFFEKK